MNHKYPDNYHGYSTNGSGLRNMSYGAPPYGDPSAMVRMGNPRENFPMQGYGDPRHAMMGQQSMMYNQSAIANQQANTLAAQQANVLAAQQASSIAAQQARNPYPMGDFGGYRMHQLNSGVIGSSHSREANDIRGSMPSSYYSSATVPSINQPQAQAPHPGLHTMPHYGQLQSSNHLQQPQHMNAAAMQRPVGLSHQIQSQPSAGPSQMPPQPTMRPTLPPQSPCQQLSQQTSPHVPAPPFTTHGSPPVMAGGSHPVPQHPMRDTSSQQNPQEVADNILQIASSYPSNHTVQVPLKTRPAPYHIPRSPHYSVSSQSDAPYQLASTSQQLASPGQGCHTSPGSSHSGVQSPNSILGNVPNPIPSPGISEHRSPYHQVMSPCTSQPSPAHMSSYPGHNQSYSPSQMNSNFSPHSHNATSPEAVMAQQQAMAHQQALACSRAYSNYSSTSSHSYSLYSSTTNRGQVFSSCIEAPKSSYDNVSSPASNDLSTSNLNLQQKQGHNFTNSSNNPLSSLERLVMLPESQVVDPKSVVNDACLATEQSQLEEGSKNVDDPAVRPVKGSGLSVGSPSTTTPLDSKLCHSGHSIALNCKSGHSGSVKVLDEMSNHSDNAAALDDHSIQSDNTVAVDILSQSDSIAESDVISISSDISTSQSETATSLDIMSNKSSTAEVLTEDEGKLEHYSSKSERIENHNLFLHRQDEMDISSNISENKLRPQPLLNSSVVDSEIIDFKLKESNLVNEDFKINNSITPEKCVENDVKETLTKINETKDKLIKSEEGPVSLEKELQNNFNFNSISKYDVCPEPKVLEKDMGVVGANTDTTIPVNMKRKIDKLEEDSKCIPPKRSPSVLSEVPVLTNGCGDTSCLVKESIVDDNNITFEDHHEPNGIRSISRTTVIQTKKINSILRIIPCSITVGANERAACDRFAFRRNGYCRTLRNSRVICNGRDRSDSVGNDDSDGSFDSLSENNIVSGIPQDGNRKRSSTTKKSDAKETGGKSGGSLPSSKKAADKASKSSNSNGSSNGHIPYNNNGVSDDDSSYYEGVDNTDFLVYVNNFSSDDSINSNDDAKFPLPSTLFASSINANVSNEIDIKEKSIENMEQPKSDFSPQTKKKPKKNLPKQTKKIRPKPNKTPKAKIESEVNDVATVDELRGDSPILIDSDGSDAKESQVEQSDRKPDMSTPLLLTPEKKSKYPVVVLDKCCAIPSVSIKTDQSDQLPKALITDTLNKIEPYDCVEPSLVKRDDDSKQDINIDAGEPWMPKVLNSKRSTLPQKRSLQKISRKRKSIQKKQVKKNKLAPKQDKSSELRDSFKSMKFGRTLDLMKSQKKREIGLSGPFIRISGKKISPTNVNLFQQPFLDLQPSNKHQSKKKHQQQYASAANVVHFSTNLPSDKNVMAPSSKTIEQNAWACVFCGHQSSYRTMGDLFGPYYKDSDLPRVEKYAANESKSIDSEKRLSGNIPSTSKPLKDVPGLVKKRKPGPKSKKDALPEEVWVHEACAMWSPGVCLIAGRIYGLDDAIQDARENMCSVCNQIGAMIGCLYKGCSMKFHIVCAIDDGCLMNEENFSVLCQKHKGKKMGIGSANISFS